MTDPISFMADALITLGSGVRPDLKGPQEAPRLDLATIPIDQRGKLLTAWLSRNIGSADQRLAFCHGDVCPTCEGHGTVVTEEMQAVLSIMADHYGRVRSAQKTVEHRADIWALNFVRNIKRRPAFATALREPYKGVPAFIVGAGPSLDRNGHLLARARKRGLVFAVNTSAPAALAHGCDPHVVMCSEVEDVRAGVVSSPTATRVMDLIASGGNWDAAWPAMAFTSSENFIVPYVLRLGGRTLNFTGSVSTAAIALAILWGCDPIVLVGQDLSYPAGKMYANGAPYEDMRAEARKDHIEYMGTTKKHDRQFIAWVQGQDGKPVHTSHGLLRVIDWVQKAATRHEIINATEGGAKLQGTRQLGLNDMIRMLPERDVQPVPEGEPIDPQPILDELVQKARETIDRIATGFPAATADFPLLWMPQQAIQLRIAKQMPEAGTRERIEALRTGLVNACEQIMEAAS